VILLREEFGKGTTSVVPTSQKKDSGIANPPVRIKTTPPAHFSPNPSAALSIISQVMESFSILTLP
jgi:hypothetical protein